MFLLANIVAQNILLKKQKLIIEGTVDVSKSKVKVDISVKIDNFYKLARCAFNTNNGKVARQYYESILLEDPDSWEATLYSTYLSYIGSDLNEIQALAHRMAKCAGIVLTQIKETALFTEYENVSRCVSGCCNRFPILYCDEAMHTNTEKPLY